MSMTLPASFPLSMSQIAAELGLSLPLKMDNVNGTHGWLTYLAGIQTAGRLPPPGTFSISFSQLLGKTAHFNGNLTGQGAGPTLVVSFSGAPFFGGNLNTLSQQSSALSLSFSVPPYFLGNILVTNTTFGTGAVLTKQDEFTWTGTGNVVPSNTQTTNITIYPST